MLILEKPFFATCGNIFQKLIYEQFGFSYALFHLE